MILLDMVIRIYIGTADTKKGSGIYTCLFNTDNAELSDLTLAAEVFRPGFLEIAPNNSYLYSVGELKDYSMIRPASLCSFKINKQSGVLDPINSESTDGDGPCHIVIDQQGRNVLTANYHSGSCAVLPINACMPSLRRTPGRRCSRRSTSCHTRWGVHSRGPPSDQTAMTSGRTTIRSPDGVGSGKVTTRLLSSARMGTFQVPSGRLYAVVRIVASCRRGCWIASGTPGDG